MVVIPATEDWQRACTFPATPVAPGALMTPLDTTSPTTVSPLLIVIALPAMPPQPAWLRAASVGVYRRLFTPATATADSCGAVPLVRIRANCNARPREAVMVNCVPAGPSAATSCLSTVPSGYVQVTGSGGARAAPDAGAHVAALYN